jgi:hypothetical protein
VEGGGFEGGIEPGPLPYGRGSLGRRHLDFPAEPAPSCVIMPAIRSITVAALNGAVGGMLTNSLWGNCDGHAAVRGVSRSIGWFWFTFPLDCYPRNTQAV